MSDVFFEILSPLPLNRHQDARKLFQLWAENAINFLPDRWGLYEPLRHHFSMSSLEEAIRSWEFNFLVKRTASPKLEGSIFMQRGPHRSHSVWSISLEVKDLSSPHSADCCCVLSRLWPHPHDYGGGDAKRSGTWLNQLFRYGQD